jgi:hypothetical protein
MARKLIGFDPETLQALELLSKDARRFRIHEASSAVVAQGSPTGPSASAAGEDRPRLRKIAEALLCKAEEGDLQAIKELADRVDGKVPQTMGGTEDNQIKVIHSIERVFREPDRREIDYPVVDSLPPPRRE